MTDRVYLVLDKIEEHAQRWERWGPKLTEVATAIDHLEFRHLSQAKDFQSVMSQHEALITKIGGGCREGAAIWAAIAAMLRVAEHKYEFNEDAARQRLTRLHDEARADANHPMHARMTQSPAR
ncbi:MAG TPA: hypothetical protein VFC00_34170 [Micromonosporaceae bacterium]|nr:hypothetical protein [Micromonosporaceae bacterium]